MKKILRALLGTLLVAGFVAPMVACTGDPGPETQRRSSFYDEGYQSQTGQYPYTQANTK